jgi:hypothetical protein
MRWATSRATMPDAAANQTYLDYYLEMGLTPENANGF